MQGLRWLQMSNDERDEFLGQGGTGVISFSTGSDEPPVSLPISYGYNATDRTFYFNLSLSEDSEKAHLVDEPVSFVTHRETDQGWKSVVATGTLKDISEESYSSDAIQGMWAIEIPAVDIFQRPRREVTFHHFLLDPEQVTGRKEVITDM